MLGWNGNCNEMIWEKRRAEKERREVMILSNLKWVKMSKNELKKRKGGEKRRGEVWRREVRRRGEKRRGEEERRGGEKKSWNTILHKRKNSRTVKRRKVALSSV